MRAIEEQKRRAEEEAAARKAAEEAEKQRVAEAAKGRTRTEAGRACCCAARCGAPAPRRQAAIGPDAVRVVPRPQGEDRRGGAARATRRKRPARYAGARRSPRRNAAAGPRRVSEAMDLARAALRQAAVPVSAPRPAPGGGAACRPRPFWRSRRAPKDAHGDVALRSRAADADEEDRRVKRGPGGLPGKAPERELRLSRKRR